MRNVNDDPRIAEFAAYSKIQVKRSKKTAEDYAHDVELFAEFIAPIQVERATDSHIMQYISHCLDRGLKRRTVGRRFFALKAFFQFLRLRHIRDDDPTEGVNVPEDENPEERVVLIREEVLRAINAPGEHYVTKLKDQPLRDKAMLCLYYSGLRRNEVVDVNREDLNLDAKQCKLPDRTVPLSSETVAALRAYLSVRPKSNERALFLTFNYKRFQPRTAWAIATKAGLRAGVEKPVSPETLRTAFAVHWIEDGRNPFDLAPILGIEPSGIENYAKLARNETDDSEVFILTGMNDALFDHLDMRRTKSTWHKIAQRTLTDPAGAITQTRTLLEAICKQILSTIGVEIPKTETLSGMCKRALIAVLPPDGDEDEHFTKFARIASGLVDHLSLYRNIASDAHSASNQRAIEQHQARYAVGLAMSTAAFLVHCFASFEATRSARSLGQGQAFVLPLTKMERDLLALLLQTASRTSSGDKRIAYNELLQSLTRGDRSRSRASETYLQLAPEEVTLLRDLIPTTSEGSKQAAIVGKRLHGKLTRLSQRHK